jgi:hypothetical protein
MFLEEAAMIVNWLDEIEEQVAIPIELGELRRLGAGAPPVAPSP